MLDISTSSVLFLTDTVSNSSSAVICLYVKSFSDTNSLSQSSLGSESKNSTDPEIGMKPKDSESKTVSDSGNGLAIPKDSESKNVADPEHGMSVKDTESKTLSKSESGLVFVMTRNAHIVVLDSGTGNMIRSWPMHPKMDSTAIALYIIGE